ncbi:MAG TPA: winged helix-turn-helix domain-containing protein [Vicinamibacterales bacterium]|jgi:Tol biopolymer transport system component/DNA-binding winged helix-turn-helix (wHTH) protein|nr:winged helix-turn-helix domain-containing protein [Vicinamibacterales bacterium]
MRTTRRRFGRFELDVEGLRLFRDGRRVKIQPQPLRMLLALTDRPGELVTRDELRTLIWGHATYVEFDQGLGYCARQIRLALADDAGHPIYVETIKGRGYRFVAPVIEEGPATQIAGAPQDHPVAHDADAASVPAIAPVSEPARLRARAVAITAAATVVAASVGIGLWTRLPTTRPIYTQVTNFTDAAVSPAVSPDGRTIAFIREAEPSYPIEGEVFVKRLPGSEAVQLTHDGFPKYGVTFSPDGSEITYTVATSRQWNTMAVSVLGGEPRLLLTNASGLRWLDPHRVLFSEFTSGIHMGLVTATDTRADLRRIYLPAHERGMAHEGSLSADRRWVLVVEMGPDGGWQPCRLVPFDGRSSGAPVGPPDSHCTSAAWSADGRVMYFAASTGLGSHIWRQRFPNGPAEQLTDGPQEEQGVALSADGRSLLTSVGSEVSELWIRNESGERLLSSEGFAQGPSYSSDGGTLYYMLGDVATGRPSELWAFDVNSGKGRPIVQGFLMRSYDVSEDGRTIVFSARAGDGRSELWLASADHSFAPQRLSSSGSDSPFFGSAGRIVFRATDGKANYLFEMDSDGSHRRKVRAEPIIELMGRSRDRRWVVSMVPAKAGPPVATVLVPLEHGDEQRVCPALCSVKWSPSGDRFFLQPVQDFARGDALVFPLAGHEASPVLPAAGVVSVAEGASLAGASVVHLGAARNRAVPGPSAETFVYTKTVAHRNLFWISLR